MDEYKFDQTSLDLLNDLQRNFTKGLLKSNDDQIIKVYVNLVKKLFIDPYSDYCAAKLISAGFLNVTVNSTNIRQREYINNPMLFISCAENKKNGGGETKVSEALLKDISWQISQHIDWALFNGFYSIDKFSNSTIFVTFMTALICISSWMLLLVLALLPSDNNYRKRKLIYFYVLISCGFETGIITYAFRHIFYSQYMNDYQNSDDYAMILFDSHVYKSFEVIINFAFLFNCLQVIYYMHADKKPIFAKQSYIPEYFRKNRNFTIISIGLLYIVVDQIFFALALWLSDSKAMLITFQVIEILLYIIFGTLATFYVYKNFGYIFHPKHMKEKETLNWNDKLFLLWNDYFQTVPILIYNVVFYILLFYIFFYLVSNQFNSFSWRYGLLRLFKLIISVNAWGLLSTLEKQEYLFNSETLLGKKIDNKDKYFVNPSVQYPIAESDSIDYVDGVNDVDSYMELDQWGYPVVQSRTLESRVVPEEDHQLEQPSVSKFSTLRTMKDIKKQHKNSANESKQRSFASFRITSKMLSEANQTSTSSLIDNDKKKRTGLLAKAVKIKKVNKKFKNNEDAYYPVASSKHDDKNIKSCLLQQEDNLVNDDNDVSSIETELTRNVLFDHDD